MKARHSVASLMRWTHGILFALLVIASLIWRADVKPERVEPEIEEQEGEPSAAVCAYIILFAVLSIVTLIILAKLTR